MKKKIVSNWKGRPKFTYQLPSKVKKQVVDAQEDPLMELVSLPFSRLRHVCRFEKCGYCKQAKKSCNAQNCHQTRK